MHRGKLCKEKVRKEGSFEYLPELNVPEKSRLGYNVSCNEASDLGALQICQRFHGCTKNILSREKGGGVGFCCKKKL